MTPFEMAQSCAKAIEHVQQFGGKMEEAPLMLTMRGPWKPPKRFPRGRLNIVHQDGRRVWTFNAANVLAWLVGSKLVEATWVVAEGGYRMEIKDTSA
jgi:hypothetical protein